MSIFAFLVVLSLASVALADNFKTVEGKEYKNVTVRRVEPDGIVLSSSTGIFKVYFTELTKEVQERFHYDPEQAAAYSMKTYRVNGCCNAREALPARNSIVSRSINSAKNFIGSADVFRCSMRP